MEKKKRYLNHIFKNKWRHKNTEKDKIIANLNKISDVKLVISRIMKNKNTWQRKYKVWEGINIPNTLIGVSRSHANRDIKTISSWINTTFSLNKMAAFFWHLIFIKIYVFFMCHVPRSMIGLEYTHKNMKHSLLSRTLSIV